MNNATPIEIIERTGFQPGIGYFFTTTWGCKINGKWFDNWVHWDHEPTEEEIALIRPVIRKKFEDKSLEATPPPHKHTK